MATVLDKGRAGEMSSHAETGDEEKAGLTPSRGDKRVKGERKTGPSLAFTIHLSPK